MPIVVPDDYQAAMSGGSFTTRHVLDVFYNGQPTLTGLSIASQGSLSGRADASIQTSGRIVVKQASQFIAGGGDSLAPSQALDILGTVGQECVVSRQVYLGQEFVGSVPYGRFRITEIPTIEQTARRFGSAQLITSALVELVIKDLFEPIDAADFATIEAPRPDATVWSEVRRLSPVPVVQSIANPAVSSATIYDSSRLATITKLLQIAGAVPHMTRQGALTGRLTDPFSSTAVAPIELRGTVQSLSRGMSNDYRNRVVITSTVNGADQIVAEARVSTGPLRFNGPAGERVVRRNAGLATTAAAQQALADSILAESLRGRMSTVRVTCVPDMRIELGDAVTAIDPQTGRVETGMVTGKMDSMNPTELQQIDLATQVRS